MKTNSLILIQEVQVIHSQIHNIDADVIGLTELRHPELFIAELDNYRSITEYTNAGKNSLALSLLYKPEKVYPVKTIKKWISETPDYPSPSLTNQFGRIIVGTKFHIVKKRLITPSYLWIFLVHFGFDEDEKVNSIKCLQKIIDEETLTTDKIIVMGDMNFFNESTNLRQMFTNNNYVDVGEEMYFSFNQKLRCYSTYVGYHYPHKLSYEELLTNEKVSKILSCALVCLR